MATQQKNTIEELISRSQDTQHGFKRALGPLNLTTLGIGAIIGAGIFVLTGQAAAQYAGPAIVISFIISGLACAFAGLCYAEFSSMIPVAGSAYTYAYATMGRFVAWIIGWDLILEYLFAASTVSVGWSGYVVSFFKHCGLNIIPPEFSAALGTKLIQIPVELASKIGLPESGWVVATQGLLAQLASSKIDIASLAQVTAIFNLPAIFIIAVLTILLVVGIKESAFFNTIVVVIKVSVVLLFIAIGIAYVKPENWTPFMPENSGTFGQYGWSGIFRGAGVIFFAYIGFDAVSTAAQEAKNPQRDMPIGILGSLTICSILYILVAIVATGIVKYDQLGVSAPIALVANKTGVAWLKWAIEIGAIAGLSSVILVMLLGQPRIFYSMAKDGLLPKIFSAVHPKFRTPHVTTILTGVVAMVLAGILPISILGELVSIGTLLAFAIVCAGVLVLRYTKPDLPRPFKTPLMPWVPILGIIASLAQMLALPLDTWMRLFVWMAIGFCIYFGRQFFMKNTEESAANQEVKS